MTPRDIQILHDAYAAYNEAFNDPDPIPRLRAAFERYFDPEIEWINASQSPDQATAHGIAGVLKWFEDGLEVWEAMRQVPEEFHDAGDQVVVFVKTQARERDSGIELSEPWAHVCAMRGGKIARLEQFRDRGKALAAADLRS